MATPKVFTGKEGKFVYNGNEILHVRNWTVEASLALLDVTLLGDTAVSNESSLRSYTGSCTVLYNAENNNALAGMLDDAFLVGGEPVKVTASFRWKGTRNIAFDAFITSANITASAGEIITADVSFTAAGDLKTNTL